MYHWCNWWPRGGGGGMGGDGEGSLRVLAKE